MRVFYYFWKKFSPSTLWTFRCARSVKRVSQIFYFNHVLRRLNEENDLSELKLLIGNIINIFNISFIKEKTFSSHFFNTLIVFLEIIDD